MSRSQVSDFNSVGEKCESVLKSTRSPSVPAVHEISSASLKLRTRCTTLTILVASICWLSAANKTLIRYSFYFLCPTFSSCVCSRVGNRFTPPDCIQIRLTKFKHAWLTMVEVWSGLLPSHTSRDFCANFINIYIVHKLPPGDLINPNVRE